MVGLYCAVSGCKNNLARCRRLGLNVTFHRFPTDPSLREIWIECCNRGKDWRKQNVFMCSAHFSPSDLLATGDGGRKRTSLVKGAVPCRNLPASKYECCAVGCTRPPPEILVRRFPTDIKRIMELLGEVPRKQGISRTECYLCERHLVLKKFLKDEVEKIAEEKEAEERGLVILEVSQVDGRHSARVIEPPAKRRKVRFESEEDRSMSENEEVVRSNKMEVVEPEIRDESSAPEKFISVEKKLPDTVNADDGSEKSLPASQPNSSIGAEPLPVFVKNGDTSELMFLHRLPHISAGLLPKLDTLLNADLSKTGEKRCSTAVGENEFSSPKGKSNFKSTGDVLIDRLYKRIQELEKRIASQREEHKMKMAGLKDKFDSKVKYLVNRLKEAKSESPRYIGRRDVVNKGRTSSSLSPSISDEVHQVLQRSFTKNQIRKIINESEPVRWTDSELLDAYTLKRLSYGAYTFVRNRLRFPLPSPKHLRRWLSNAEKLRVSSRDPEGGVESEKDNGLDVLVAESFSPQNLRGEVTLELPSEGLHGGEEILIVADPDDASSSTGDVRSHGFVCKSEKNGFKVCCALETSEGSFVSTNVYALKRIDEITNDEEPIQDESSCSGNFNCELTVQSDEESDKLGDVVIVGNVIKDEFTCVKASDVSGHG